MGQVSLLLFQLEVRKNNFVFFDVLVHPLFFIFVCCFCLERREGVSSRMVPAYRPKVAE